MPLILAIEPDRRQSSKLAFLARNQLHAELIVADSVEQALDAMDDQVPDLLLTSPLISSKDGMALANRLRELDAEGLHVQTVLIPTLTMPGQRARTPQRGSTPVRGRTLSNPSMPNGGCDSVVFGMQILAHLERRASEHPRVARTETPATVVRAAARVPVAKTAVPAPIATAAAPAPLEVTERPPESDSTEGAAGPDWSEILSAMRRDIEAAHTGGVIDATLAETAPETFVPAEIAPRSEIRLKPDPTASAPRVKPDPTVAASAARPGPDPTGAADEIRLKPDPTPDLPRKKRRPKSPPQDEWGVFDPQQCGLSLLISKVNETTGKPGGPAKKPA